MKRTTSILALAIAAALPSIDAALAGDALQADASHHKLELQNDCVRVIRAFFKPGEKSDDFFDAKGVVAVSLSGAQGFKVNFPDGTSRELPPIPAGAAWWAPGGPKSIENAGDAPVEYLVIEPQAGCKN